MIKWNVNADEAVGEILIDRPGKMNALTLDMRRDVGKAFKALGDDPNVKVIVVKGASGVFSAGGDISEFLSLTVNDLIVWGENLSAAEGIPKPVIAQLEGHTFGAGLELALACDIRIATPRSEFAMPEIRLGMAPASGGVTRIVKMVGLSRAAYLLTLGKRIDAATALQWGLIHEVVEEAKIEERIKGLAKELANFSPLALQAMKKMLRSIADSPFEAGLEIERKTFGVLRYSEDFKEGVNAFLQKRTAKFQGK